jgi:hypothetical protein
VQAILVMIAIPDSILVLILIPDLILILIAIPDLILVAQSILFLERRSLFLMRPLPRLFRQTFWPRTNRAGTTGTASSSSSRTCPTSATAARATAARATAARATAARATAARATARTRAAGPTGLRFMTHDFYQANTQDNGDSGNCNRFQHPYRFIVHDAPPDQ